VVRWDAVANATGYRVQRADAAGGPFTVNADLNITTGKATAGSDVVNLLSEKYSYKPANAGIAAPDTSPWFEYVETVTTGATRRYFRVAAYNANGDAPPSAVVCGVPTGRPAC
jgi:hypothetical protein